MFTFQRARPKKLPPATPSRIIPLGLAWAGNSVNCVPYRHSAILSVGKDRIVSYFDGDGDVVLAHISQTDRVTKEVIPTPAKPFDAHQSISIGRDYSGRIHVAFGAHNSTILMARSRSAILSEGFEQSVAIEGKHTYPAFLNICRELILLFRSGPHFRGSISVHRIDVESELWVADPQPIISGLGEPWSCGPYLNTPVTTPDGKATLFIVWRMQEEASTAGAVVNTGIDCIQSRDGLRSFQTVNGVGLSLPVTPTTAERVIAVPFGANLINQAASAARRDGRPAVLTYWKEGVAAPQFRLGWFDDNSMRVQTVSHFTTDFGLDGGGTLPLPHSRPELLFDDQDRALILFRTREQGNRLMLTILKPPDYKLSSAVQRVLVDDDLGFYEPIVDRGLWRDAGHLGIYVQYCEQGRGEDGLPRRSSSPARFIEWTNKNLQG